MRYKSRFVITTQALTNFLVDCIIDNQKIRDDKDKETHEKGIEKKIMRNR